MDSKLRLDDRAIAAALIHCTVEKTPATKTEIEKEFGAEVAELVGGLRKIEQLNLSSKKALQAVNFGKLLIAISNDKRVLFVRLADRLHRMRTIKYIEPEKRRIAAQETIDIYAPLAGRLGIQESRGELQELCLRWLDIGPGAASGSSSGMRVHIRDNNVDQALKALNYYEKPSEKRAREKAEAVRRTRKFARNARKLARKKAQRDELTKR